MLITRVVRNSDKIHLNVPKEVRLALKLNPGDLVLWRITSDQAVMIFNATPQLRIAADAAEAVHV